MISSYEESALILEKLKDEAVPVVARMRTADGSSVHLTGFIWRYDDEGIFISAEGNLPSPIRRGLIFRVDGSLASAGFEFGDMKEILEQTDVIAAIKKGEGEICLTLSGNHEENSWLAVTVKSGAYLGICFQLKTP